MVNYQIQPGEKKQDYTERIARETKESFLSQRQKMISGDLKISMDVDDFGFLLPGHEDLMRLKKSLPNLKMTLFTIPMDSKFFNSQNAKHFKWDAYKRWAHIVNEMDWIEIALHGFAHVHNECDVNYNKSITIMKSVENLFKRVGLEYVKLVKAPYWQMSYDFMMACKDMGYTVAIDKDHIRPVPDGLKSYIFNWSFEQPIPMEGPIRGHGHFSGNNQNNICDTIQNILTQIPKETQFQFVSEVLREQGDDTPRIKKMYSKDEIT